MEYIGKLVTGDFGDNTMTFEIEGEMTLQAGRYKIVQIEAGNAVKNNVDLADVVGPSEQLCRTFFPDGKTTSATKCQFCGKEKWEH